MKSSKIIGCNFEYDKGAIRKMSPFLYTFFGGGKYGGGRQFFQFFFQYYES
jgi:hypothetical protein